MEIKDIILLMMIPIIIVSIVVYTDKNTAITGAATSQSPQQEENNIIGTYSIMPSFKAKVDYNLEEYKDIDKELNHLIENCKNSQDIEQCFKDKSNELKWNCEESKDESLDILYDFINKFNECIELEEDGVVCRFSLDERTISKLIGVFAIILTNENQGVKMQLVHGKATFEDYINLPNLVYTNFNDKDKLSENLNSVRIILEYVDNKKPVIKEIVGEDTNSKTVPLSKTILLYKKDNIIKFVEAQGSSFEAPPPANKIIDLPRIKGIKFCAKSKNQIYAYDKSHNTVKLRDIVYKFAVIFPNPSTPPPIKSLKAEDKLKAEKSIVLKWDKVKSEDGSEVSDFDHYNIYCSKKYIQNENTKEINLDSLKPTMAVKSNTNYDEWTTDISKCGNEEIKDGIDYYFAVTAFSKSKKESKAIVQSTAKSIDDLSPGPQNIVLINSDNIKEEKISSACINLPIEKDNKPSYIWVGFFKPEKNEDEVTPIPVEGQLDYYLHFAKQNVVDTNLNICSDPRKCVKLFFVPKDDYSSPQEEIDLRTFDKLAPYKFEEGQTHCFTIVAKDNNGNVIKIIPYKFDKPQQWVELQNKPIIKGFFGEKDEIKYY